MYKTTKWTVATFCLVAAVFGCVAENVIQNTSTNYERIFYATLVAVNKIKKAALKKLQNDLREWKNYESSR
jgi:DMSO reductase anchor subunit